MKSIKNKLDAVSIQGNVLGTSEKWGRKKSADPRKLSRRTSVHGIIRRSRSIQIDSDSPAGRPFLLHLFFNNINKILTTCFLRFCILFEGPQGLVIF